MFDEVSHGKAPRFIEDFFKWLHFKITWQLTNALLEKIVKFLMTAISDLSLQISTPSHRNTPTTKRPRTQERPGNRHSGPGTPLSTALGTEALRQACQGGNRNESRSQKNCGRTQCTSGWYNGRNPREGQGLDQED